LFDRVATVARDGRMILLMDPKTLLDRAERDVLAAITAARPASAPTSAPGSAQGADAARAGAALIS
jgi:purine-binding chemotaxis protein CheW